MGKRCEKCAGKPFCSCPKTRAKDGPPEKWRSPRRDRVKTHDWSPWVRCRRDNPLWSQGHEFYDEPSLPGDYLVKICDRCGRARVRRKPL